MRWARRSSKCPSLLTAPCTPLPHTPWRATWQVDEALGYRLVELAKGCGERVHPGLRSLVHFAAGNVLRKRCKPDEALVQLRAAADAAWDGGKGEKDRVSLSMIPEVLLSSSMARGRRGESGAARERMAQAVEAARESLGATPPSQPMYPSVQLSLARMICNMVVLLSSSGGAEAAQTRALLSEGTALARSILNGAGARDPRVAAMAQKLLEPGQPFGAFERQSQMEGLSIS